MSMHKVPLTELEREGLILHHLPVGSPSQLSDAFRLGMSWCAKHHSMIVVLNEKIKELEDQLKSKTDDITRASNSAYRSGIAMGKAIAYDEMSYNTTNRENPVGEIVLGRFDQ